MCGGFGLQEQVCWTPAVDIVSSTVCFSGSGVHKHSLLLPCQPYYPEAAKLHQHLQCQ